MHLDALDAAVAASSGTYLLHASSGRIGASVLSLDFGSHHMEDDNLKSELERLKAENARLKSERGRTVSLKVSGKGGVSVYASVAFPSRSIRSSG